MHLNISSLPCHIDELTNLLNELNTNFKVIVGITESRLTTKKDEINSIELSNYNIEHTPTKYDEGGVLLFISKQLNYKNSNDLKMYQDKTLEYVFVEIISKTQKNTIVGCIYKHPKLSTSDFTNIFLQPLLDKLSYETKNIILQGDFNIDLLHYE